MGLGESKQQILEKYNPYVRSIAVQVRRQFRSQFELDELMAYGQLGLLEAADRFDAKMGANFLTFAHYRIKGAIYDGLRKMGILKGSDQRAAYQSERAASYMGNLSDRDQGARNFRGSIDDDVREISAAVTGLAVVFAASAEAADGLDMVDTDLPADQRLEMEELRQRVRAAMEKLPEKERKLLEGYYFQSKTLEEAGSEIGQSKSWASRLHARAIEKLKEVLEEDEDDFESSKEARSVSHGSTHRRPPGSTSGSADRPKQGGSASPKARPKQL